LWGISWNLTLQKLGLADTMLLLFEKKVVGAKFVACVIVLWYARADFWLNSNLRPRKIMVPWPSG